VRPSVQGFGHLVSRFDFLLSERAPGSWLRGMVYRQASQPRKEIRCGTPPERLSLHVARFRREWAGLLREIASACPLVAESCEALLQLDPLSKESDADIERYVARIRRVLSDPGLARSLYRERDRQAFGSRINARRKALGWSLRRLERESADAARRIGFWVRAPDRHQLMDYEAGRSNAQPRTKVVLAAALGVGVDALKKSQPVPLRGGEWECCEFHDEPAGPPCRTYRIDTWITDEMQPWPSASENTLKQARQP
jgi:transcriptional regulator with XRE-family HTH domain